MSWSDDFPRLDGTNFRFTSPASVDYNCVAWAAGDVDAWWQPGLYWPVQNWPEDDFGVGALERLFRAFGYVDCGLDVSFEPGYSKVGIFGIGAAYTHAARQLPNGKWTSKLGKGEDIEHDALEDVAGGLYGEVIQVLKRPIPAASVSVSTVSR